MATKTFGLHQAKVACEVAIREGKALVTTATHALVISAHPLSRIAPNVEGDGWPLAFDLSDTHDDKE